MAHYVIGRGEFLLGDMGVSDRIHREQFRGINIGMSGFCRFMCSIY